MFWGAQTLCAPFVSQNGVRFVAGDLGWGHVAIVSEKFAEAAQFYVDLLGGRISDTIENFGTWFIRFNGRHHSIALRPSETTSRRGLGHFMVQVEELKMVGRTLDLVEAGAAPLVATLGQHSNDGMVSFYMLTPEGITVEYGCNGRLVDPDESAGYFDTATLWGHRRDGGHN